MTKLRTVFYRQLQEHFSSRKYKEHITLACAERCLTNFREDDLTRSETRCLHNCFHKYYRFLAYSNTLYTYLVADGEMRDIIDEMELNQNMSNEEAEQAKIEALERKEI